MILRENKEKAMVQTKFTVTEKDLRSAMYFPVLLRHKRSLYLLAATLLVSLVCFLLSRFGLFADAYPLYFIALGYLFVMAVVFGGAEQTMHKYLRSPKCLVGKEYTFTLDEQNVRFCIESANVDETFPIKDFTMVVDMKTILFFHLQRDKVYIVPKRAFSAEEFETAASLLNGALGAKFTYFRLFPRRRPGREG